MPAKPNTEMFFVHVHQQVLRHLFISWNSIDNQTKAFASHARCQVFKKYNKFF